MREEIFYSDAKDSIIRVFEEEIPGCRKKFLDKLLYSFYELCTYEEEGMKVRPDILFTSNINAIVKQIPNTYKITIHKDETDVLFDQRLKSLLCFCRDEWSVYVNFTNDFVEYGLIKTINSIKEKNLIQLIFKEENLNALKEKTYLVVLDIISSSLAYVRGIQGSDLAINFKLDTVQKPNWEDVIKTFVDATISKLRTTVRKKRDIKILYENIFTSAFKNLTGCICLIVDKDFKDVKGVLSDGVWFPEPIQMSKLFLQSSSSVEEKLTSFADLFVSMLNYDGITIIDNSGKLLAYNVFISTNVKSNKNFVGGARRRAANTLIESQNKRYVGVYLQSHEGDNFFQYCKCSKAQRNKSRQRETHQISLQELSDEGDNKNTSTSKTTVSNGSEDKSTITKDN